MADDVWDREVLCLCCALLHVDPEGRLAPDIDTIANGDEPIERKIERLGDGVVENFRTDRLPA